MPRVEQIQQKALDEFRERNRASAKRKRVSKTRQTGEMVITFVCLFFLLSLLFLQVAKKMTPNVDMSVGNNSQEVSEHVEDKGTIDDRLKLIQVNDNLAAGELQKQRENEIFNNELEEKVVLPSNHKKTEAEETQDKVKEIIANNNTDVRTLDSASSGPAQTEKNATTDSSVAKAPVPTIQNKEALDKKISAITTSDVVIPASSNYKVLVGKYQTVEQAQLAKSILRETTIGQNAFVKYVDNVYTIQIGSYSTREQAFAVVNELTTKSFPARVYYEKPVSTNADSGKTIF